jgi:hypothetical protein
MGLGTRIAMEDGKLLFDVTDSVAKLTLRCIAGSEIRIGCPTEISGQRLPRARSIDLQKAA